MPGNKNFADDLYTETMSEMAENFFSRRCEVEARLESFARIAGQVKAVGQQVLRRWRTFFLLLVDEQAVLDFCSGAGLDASGIPALATGEPWRFKLPFAFTASGRYRKSVRFAYEAMRQATLDYLEGAYATDPKNPGRKVILPNYAGLRDMAGKINEEIKRVNIQMPSSVLAYVKTLEPETLEREALMAGGENMCRIDQEMAFPAVDFEALALPVLPAPPALEEVQDQLDALSGAVFEGRTQEARTALAQVAA